MREYISSYSFIPLQFNTGKKLSLSNYGHTLFEYPHDGLTCEKWFANEKILIPQMIMGAFSEEKNDLARFGWATSKHRISEVPNYSQKFSNMGL